MAAGMEEASGEGWRLLRGDCIDAMRGFGEGEFGLVLADPPYCSGGMSVADRKGAPSRKYQRSDAAAKHADFEGDTRDQRSFTVWCAEWMRAAYRCAADGAHALVFTDWRNVGCTADAVQAAGFVYRGLLVWAKPDARPQPNSFRQSCEFVAWATKGAIDRKPSPGAVYLPGHYVAASPRGNGRAHMNQKPVGLLADLLKIAPAGARALDPFAGVGSAGVACARMGLGYVGVEQSAHYFAMAADRVREAYRVAAEGE